jgi:MFS family permease
MLLPNSLALFVFSILAGRWVGKYSTQKMISGGLLVLALGLILMNFWLTPDAGFMAYLLPLVLMGAGYSVANTPRFSVVLPSAPPELAGAVSATNNASLKLGSAFGIAVMGAFFQSIARNTYISDRVEASVQTADIRRSAEVIGAWLQTNSGNVAGEFGITVQQLEGVIGNYQNTFTTGTAQALLVAAVVAWFTYREGRSETQTSTSSTSGGKVQ